MASGQSKSARLVLGTDVNKLSLTDLLLLEGQVIRKKVVIFDDRGTKHSKSRSGSRSRSPPDVTAMAPPQGRIKQAINDKLQKRSVFAARKTTVKQ